MAFTVVNQIHILGYAAVIKMGLYRVLYACMSGALHFFFLFLFLWYRAGIKGKNKKNNSEQIFMHSKALRHRLYQNQTCVWLRLVWVIISLKPEVEGFTLHLKLIIQRTNSTKATNTHTLGMLEVVLHPGLKQWPNFCYRFTPPGHS
jgi:hypothetical protein